MAERPGDGSIAPRRSLGGPILPPPPPAMAEEARKHEKHQAAARQAEARRQAEREARQAQKDAKREAAAKRQEESRRAAEAKRVEEAKRADEQRAREREAREKEAREKQAAQERNRSRATAPVPATSPVTASGDRSSTAGTAASAASARTATGRAPRRTRRAQLRLVQVDAWSVMKTAFMLSIALGIVLVVAVAIVWSVLGAAGVWDSINSIVQQAVGTDGGTQFDIQQYVGASRVLGFTMIVAVLDVILITAIATLGAFLYNLSAALLGGIEVTLAEDS